MHLPQQGFLDPALSIVRYISIVFVRFSQDLDSFVGFGLNRQSKSSIFPGQNTNIPFSPLQTQLSLQLKLERNNLSRTTKCVKTYNSRKGQTRAHGCSRAPCLPHSPSVRLQIYCEKRLRLLFSLNKDRTNVSVTQQHI